MRFLGTFLPDPTDAQLGIADAGCLAEYGRRTITWREHAGEIWACDFLQVTDALFRPLFAFFTVELRSRRVVHVGVTRHPTDAWVAQQLREAMPYGERPPFLVRDNDRKYGPRFRRWPR